MDLERFCGRNLLGSFFIQKIVDYLRSTAKTKESLLTVERKQKTKGRNYYGREKEKDY